jgi:hypothetical protein
MDDNLTALRRVGERELVTDIANAQLERAMALDCGEVEWRSLREIVEADYLMTPFEQRRHEV